MNIEVKEYILRLVEQGYFEGYDVEEFTYLMEEDECWISSGSSPSSSEFSRLSDE